MQNTVYGNSHPPFFPGKHNLLSRGISHVKKQLDVKQPVVGCGEGVGFGFYLIQIGSRKKKKLAILPK